jgi:hypothetical protein
MNMVQKKVQLCNKTGSVWLGLTIDFTTTGVLPSPKFLVKLLFFENCTYDGLLREIWRIPIVTGILGSNKRNCRHIALND